MNKVGTLSSITYPIEQNCPAVVSSAITDSQSWWAGMLCLERQLVQLHCKRSCSRPEGLEGVLEQIWWPFPWCLNTDLLMQDENWMQTAILSYCVLSRGVPSIGFAGAIMGLGGVLWAKTLSRSVSLNNWESSTVSGPSHWSNVKNSAWKKQTSKMDQATGSND